MIRIPKDGLRLRFWSRTAVPEHRFLITLTHHDVNQQWMPGKNNDITLSGTGRWQEFDEQITRFPDGAEFVRFQARATRWTEAGEAYIYWFDEPDPHQYPFVMDGFAKLKKSCPRLARKVTEQVEPGLLGGPDIWCYITAARRVIGSAG